MRRRFPSLTHPHRAPVVALTVAAWCVSAPLELSAQTPAPTPSTAVAFQDVTVIDVTNGTLLPDQTVTVVGNRIQSVAPAKKAKVPQGAQVVEAQGKFLIPGLWDMHAHTEWVSPKGDVQAQDANYRKAYPRYIASGVTGIREMAQRFVTRDSFLSWQRAVMAGTRVGPRAPGPSADLSYKFKIETTDDVRRIVDSLKAAGDVFIKYHGVPREPNLFFAVLREAKRVGIPVVGHVPNLVSLQEAVDSGLRSVEHINEHRACYPYPDEGKCTPVAEAYLRTGAWFVPTASIFYYYAPSEGAIEDYRTVIRFMHDKGVRKILAGTDCEPHFQRQTLNLAKVCHYGFSVLQETMFLQESGLTPLEALQSATLNPALFFEATDSLGTVAQGKLADLVLLDANPLVNFRNILKIRSVMANGRYFDRAALDAMDPRAGKLATLYAEWQPNLDDEPPYEEMVPAAITPPKE